jgi:hypothetical protein
MNKFKDQLIELEQSFPTESANFHNQLIGINSDTYTRLVYGAINSPLSPRDKQILQNYRDLALISLNNKNDQKGPIFKEPYITNIRDLLKLNIRVGGNRKYKRKSFKKRKGRQRITRSRK